MRPCTPEATPAINSTPPMMSSQNKPLTTAPRSKNTSASSSRMTARVIEDHLSLSWSHEGEKPAWRRWRRCTASREHLSQHDVGLGDSAPRAAPRDRARRAGDAGLDEGDRDRVRGVVVVADHRGGTVHRQGSAVLAV